MSALRSAEDLPDDTPLRRLRKLVDGYITKVDQGSGSFTG